MKRATSEIQKKLEDIRRRLANRNAVIEAVRTNKLRNVIEALTQSFDDANMMVQLAWLQKVPAEVVANLPDNPLAVNFTIVERAGALNCHSTEKEDTVETLDQEISDTLALFSPPHLSENSWLMLVALESEDTDVARYLANIYKALFKQITYHRILDEPMAQAILREKQNFYNVFSVCCGRAIWDWLFLNDSQQDKIKLIDKVLSLGWVDVNARNEQGKLPLQLLVELKMFLGDYVKQFFICLIKNNADFSSLTAEEKEQLFSSLKNPSRSADVLEEMIKLDRADICQYLVDGGVDVQGHHLEAALDRPEISDIFKAAGFNNSGPR